jgi:hypothetical protein
MRVAVCSSECTAPPVSTVANEDQSAFPDIGDPMVAKRQPEQPAAYVR